MTIKKIYYSNHNPGRIYLRSGGHPRHHKSSCRWCSLLFDPIMSSTSPRVPKRSSTEDLPQAPKKQKPAGPAKPTPSHASGIMTPFAPGIVRAQILVSEGFLPKVGFRQEGLHLRPDIVYISVLWCSWWWVDRRLNEIVRTTLWLFAIEGPSSIQIFKWWFLLGLVCTQLFSIVDRWENRPQKWPCLQELYRCWCRSDCRWCISPAFYYSGSENNQGNSAAVKSGS